MKQCPLLLKNHFCACGSVILTHLFTEWFSSQNIHFFEKLLKPEYKIVYKKTDEWYIEWYSLSIIAICCHSLSLVVTCCHSLSLFAPLVVICYHSLSLDVPLVCLFINDLFLRRLWRQSVREKFRQKYGLFMQNKYLYIIPSF